MGSNVRARIQSLSIDDRVTSTNDRVREASPEAGRACCAVAAEQTAGRGRRGRVWDSPPGAGLYYSLATGRSSAAPGYVSLAVVARIVEILAGFGIHGLTLKWPNDILRDGCKLGGILVEQRQQGGRWILVVGFGLNLASQAAADRIGLADWMDPGEIPDAQLLARLTEELVGLLLEMDLESAWPRLRAIWEAHDHFRDQGVRIIDEQGEHTGIARGVTDSGALVLEKSAGIRHCHAGEASLRSV